LGCIPVEASVVESAVKKSLPHWKRMMIMSSQRSVFRYLSLLLGRPLASAALA